MKLRSLKLSIKRWNTEVFGNIDTNLAKLEEEIACVERLLENGVDEEVNVARHKASKSLIGRWYGRRTEYWRQFVLGECNKKKWTRIANMFI